MKQQWVSFIAGVMLSVVSGWGATQTMMPKDATPAFDVATIKPARADDPMEGFRSDGHTLFIENKSVKQMVMFAYGVHDKQVVDGPAWMNERYDIHGVTDVPGAPSTRQYQAIVKKLLAGRFGLAVHQDKREMPVYTIIVAKGGPKLTVSKSDPNGQPDDLNNVSNQKASLRLTNGSMENFALEMQFFMDRPVVDKTGLTGKYDLLLEWKPELSAGDSSDLPGLFTAVQDQLGLKLNATRDLASVVVVDKIERPSAD